MALFCHFVQEAHKKSASVQYREYGLRAAGLYFLLLEIPGTYTFGPLLLGSSSVCNQLNGKNTWKRSIVANVYAPKPVPLDVY